MAAHMSAQVKSPFATCTGIQADYKSHPLRPGLTPAHTTSLYGHTQPDLICILCDDLKPESLATAGQTVS